jgi:CRISPR/Cas system-associated exonuclease Cas4 (RecB family)
MDEPSPKPLELRLSYSGMNGFLACNYRYFLQYREKMIPEFSEKSLFYLGVGSVVHEALKHLTERCENRNLSGDATQDVDTAIQEALTSIGEDKKIPDVAIPEAKRVLLDWWSPEKLYGKTVWFEKELSETISVTDEKNRLWSLTFHGIPDRIFLRMGKEPTYVITDYKTGNGSYSPVDPERSLQLWLYAWLWQRYLLRQPKVVDGYRIAIRYELVSKGEGVEVLLSSHQIESAVKRATSIAQKIMVSDFPASPGYHCYGCAFAQQCRFSTAKRPGTQTRLPEA